MQSASPFANAAAGLLSAWLMQRYCGPFITFRRLRDVAALLVIAALAGCALNATLGAGSTALMTEGASFAFALWAAVRLGPRGASVVSLSVALFAILSVVLRHGPPFFGPLSVATTVYWLQIYLTVVVLSSLALAAIWCERTVELIHANASLEAEVEERRRSEAIVSRQACEILDLSSPIVRIYRGMVLVPLIGTLGGERSQQLMTRLLERVVDERSSPVLLDITGVSEIDHETAQHLLDTIHAVRLLGAQAILTGVRAPIARTMIHLGIDLSGVATRSSLADGLSDALRMGAQRATVARAARRLLG